MRNFTKKEIMFLFVVCFSTTFLILTLMDLNSVTLDESKYIFSGKEILNGEYPYSITKRAPLIPSIISLFLFIGLDIGTIRILIPIIFMNSALITTYFFARCLYGKEEGILATLFLFTFPFFWRWGLSVLVDIPLITFCSLSLLFFYLGIERKNVYLLFSAAFLSLALLVKASAILLPIPAFLYLVYRKKWKTIFKIEFISSVFILLFIVLLVFFSFNSLISANLGLGDIIAIFVPGYNIENAFKFFLAPVLLFGFFGASIKRKQDVLLSLTILTFILFFIFVKFLVRYLSPLYPLFGIFVALGYLNLRRKVKVRKIIDTIFVVLLIVSFTNSIYLSNMEENTLWGAEDLSKYINSIEGNAIITSEYLSDYLKATTDKDIVLPPKFVEFDNKTVEITVFHSIMGDKTLLKTTLRGRLVGWVMNKTHLKVLESFGSPGGIANRKVYQEKQMRFNFDFYNVIFSFDDEWIKENKIDYVVLSVYYEFSRSPVEEYYHPKFGPFEIPFITRPYILARPPPDYQFKSKLYNRLEGSDKYEKVREIYRGNQRIFIIYKVL